MKRASLIVAVLALSSAGCVETLRKEQSSGFTGCEPEANEISNAKDSLGSSTWNATCNGKKYLCTAMHAGKDAADQVHCALAVQ